MKRSLLTLTALTALTGAVSNRVMAWNDTGHMTVAKLAYDNLTPDAKLKLNAILAKHRDYGKWMSEMPATFTDKELYAFMRSATWPDAIRKTPDDRPTWHYIDVPVVLASPDYHPDPATLDIPTPNAEVEISDQSKVIESLDTPDSDKAVSICWVAHLIGDIHQPLHCTAAFSAIFTTGDKGGNGEIVPDKYAPAYFKQFLDATPKRYYKLHTMWDDFVGTDKDPSAVVTIANALTGPGYQRSSFPELKTDTTVHSWVMEGTDLARKYVYLDGKLKQTLIPADDPARAGSLDPKTLIEIPDDYMATGVKICDQQVVKAGYRLADRLNVILAPAPAPPVNANAGNAGTMHSAIFTTTPALFRLAASTMNAPAKPTAKKPHKVIPGQATVAAKTTFGTVAASSPAVKKALAATNLAEATKQVGKTVTVSAKIASVYTPKSNKVTIIDLSPDYHNSISAVVKSESYAKFPALMMLKDKQVLITGKLVLFKDRPQIELTLPSQLKIVQ